MHDDISNPTFRAVPPGRAQDLVVGFTGSRSPITVFQRDRVLDILQSLTNARRFVTGGCMGMDHLIGVTMLQIAPDKEHVVVVPANRSRVVTWWQPYGDAVKVIEMPPDTTYAQRNREIVLLSNALTGFPAHAEHDPRSQRSGSWQTIRYARHVHRTMPHVHTLEAM